MTDALFIPQGDAFVPTELAGSPWGAALLHGGPPNGLLAYALEHARAGDEFFVARMTTDLFRPVPKSPLTIETREIRRGRRIQVIEASLLHEGEPMCRTTAVLLAGPPVTVPASARFGSHIPADPAGFDIGSLAPARRPGMLPGFHTTIEVKRITPPNMGAGGHQAAWIRVPVPVIAGVETTPLMRVASIADFANGLGQIAPDEATGFINTDISLHLHREAVGEWICLELESRAQDSGIGFIKTDVYDIDGPIGHIAQATIANPRNRP